MPSKMPKSQSVLVRNLERDAEIRRLEHRLVDHPDDKKAARDLVMILDYYAPSKQGIGAFADCQRMIAANYRRDGWSTDLLNHEKAAQHYQQWQDCLDSMSVQPQIAITQLFMGEFIAIHGAPGYCDLRLTLFKNEGVISSVCHDCYKIQILAQNLATLIQVYFIIHGLKLPRDNARKCMVELREDIPYPYKGYIYCDSEDEVKFCLQVFQQALQIFGVSGVQIGISHGCSEYGLKYPEFKFSNDGGHRSFERPASWELQESKFFSEIIVRQGDRVDNNKQGITIRDVIAFQTWIKYAQIIGDQSCKIFTDKSNIVKPERFIARVGKQAQMRNTQMKELCNRFSS